MLEKRRLKRRHPIYYLKVYDSSTNNLIGRVVDIHSQGMKLVSENPVREGDTRRLRLDLPRAVDDQDYLEFEARTVWCGLDKNPDFYDSGFQFTNIAPGDQRTIDTVFENYVFSY
jgi:c-di-GMP-binding flagellar brake protein YcgR